MEPTNLSVDTVLEAMVSDQDVLLNGCPGDVEKIDMRLVPTTLSWEVNVACLIGYRTRWIRGSSRLYVSPSEESLQLCSCLFVPGRLPNARPRSKCICPRFTSTRFAALIEGVGTGYGRELCAYLGQADKTSPQLFLLYINVTVWTSSIHLSAAKWRSRDPSIFLRSGETASLV